MLELYAHGHHHGCTCGAWKRPWKRARFWPKVAPPSTPGALSRLVWVRVRVRVRVGARVRVGFRVGVGVRVRVRVASPLSTAAAEIDEIDDGDDETPSP